MSSGMLSKRSKAELLCSSITGVVKILIIQPFDFIRYRIQSSLSEGRIKIFQTIKEIINKEGLRVLMKGAGATGVGVLSSSVIHFTLYLKCQKYFTQDRNVISACKAGFLSGFVLSIITSPIDNVRIKLQSVQNVENLGTKTYRSRGSVDCMRTIYNTFGFKGFYIALPVSMLRESVASTIYFGLFEFLKMKEKIKNGKDTIRVGNSLIYGALTGGMNWLVTLPVDTVKTKMISETILQQKHSSFAKCVYNIHNQLGWMGFYRGFSVVFTRGLIVNGVVLTSFDRCRAKFLDTY